MCTYLYVRLFLFGGSFRKTVRDVAAVFNQTSTILRVCIWERNIRLYYTAVFYADKRTNISIALRKPAVVVY